MIQRGAIWWATLPPPVGSGPGGRRPIVIIQADYANNSRIRTIIAVIVTSNLRLARHLGNVFLPTDDSGLEYDSVANVSQLVTIDQSLLTKYVGMLPDHLTDQLDEGLRLILDLY